MSEKEKKKKGCLFWGCLTMIILMIIVIVLIIAGVMWVRNKAFQYTSETPIEITQVDYTQAEATAINERVDGFIQAIEKGDVELREVFTDRDLNILLDSNSELKELKGKIKLQFIENKIRGVVNIPLTDIPIVSGRYLSGDAEFKVTCDDGEPFVSLESMMINGKDIPEEYLESMRNKNLMDEVSKDPKDAERLKRIKTIKMENNKLIIEVFKKE